MDKERKLLNTLVSRRSVLKVGSTGAVTLLAASLAGCRSKPTPDQPSAQLERSPIYSESDLSTSTQGPSESETDKPDLELTLTAIEDDVSILPDKQTQVWRYVGEVNHGTADALVSNDDSYLGPTIRVRQGQTLRIHFKNELPVPSGIHWHGLLVPERMDGHPRDHVAAGESYTYEFEVQNRAGIYWYHPHPERTTGGQVYKGLAGLFIVSDEEEEAIALPRNEQDLTLVIQDRLFDESGALQYSGNDPVLGAQDAGFYGNGHTQSMGMSGNQILINGQRDYTIDAVAQSHRLRLLNASNSRTYVLGWSDQSPMTVIGTDGGLLEAPVERPYLILGPSERVEIWADLSLYEAEDELHLISYSLGGSSPYPLARIQIIEGLGEQLPLPRTLTSHAALDIADTINADEPRQFLLGATRGGWAINGRNFELEAVADDERVQFGTSEVWEFVNDGSAGGMTMPHPMHIHGVQFKVVERQMEGANPESWQTIRAGYVDEGWKDTITLMGGERAKVQMRFDAHAGLFLIHCHVLEHEDMSMMRNFYIEENI